MAHVFLTTAFASELRRSLRGRDCRAGASDLRVGVSNSAYFYPDVVVICGKAGGRGVDDMATNPVMIVEVLSPSTEVFDRGEKFRQYQRIESLREYVLVSQTETRIEVFARQSDGEWARTEFAGPEAVCRFDCIDCEIPVAAIYEDITLGEE